MTILTTIMATLIVLSIALIAIGRIRAFGREPALAYADTAPQIDLRQHLNGPIQCEGMIHGPTGRLASRFTAQMHGHWDGANGVLAENFTYASGGTQAREWRLQLGNDGRFTATADDVIGEAQGEFSGATIRMQYRLRLPQDSGGHVLNVTDWLYLSENGVILNRSEMRKFGIKVAELFAVMRKAQV